MKKTVLTLFVILAVCSTTYAESWKKINNTTQNKNITIWIDTSSVQKADNQVMYKLRTKSKDSGDLVNLVCTDCNDKSSVIIETCEYSKNMTFEYPPFPLSKTLFVPLDTSSIMAPASMTACTLKTAPKKIKPSKTNKNAMSNKSDKSGFSKFISGVGTAIGTVIAIPIILVGVLLGGS